ncbi:MAG: hypothetical protein N3E45_15090 [Oscillatoriaceae bacterium SKW80]|nr:hypothetical protein [Oscillatoriaceae bacterium SKYG93]MCX8122123.1 hypothetical protein [Oscillatoriaceae bacterium SKW80]MDW8454410.1 hypothetical protein [Oscillatoriaceae cyanobacterium SKYGB_i_bin93]HIK29274.1 hypothetical protein [Oscillatoriaceae cyanobacterium M7585_C2015_266]
MELEVARKRCKDGLVWAIEQLGGQVDLERLDQIAELIIQTMTGPWRYFHTPEHIFEVGGSVNPIEVLAAFFHDLVYVQVDQGVSLNISSYISPFVKEVRGQLVIRESVELPKDLMFDIVAAVFGFVPGQTLSPFAGQNEFLSAVIAAKALSHALPPDIIAQIAACIEATIPFRPKLPSGESSSDMLYQRMCKLNRDFNFGWKPEEIAETVRRAVRLANRDVENFAYPNSADFLDNTWNLMPETNHELSNANSYTVRGYRKSLQKMEGFMNFLRPELVFQQFMGEPDEATYQQLVSRTAKNLAVAKLYLGSKLVAIAIVEALSYRLGRDLPLSTMMGELPNSGVQIESLENFLPDIPLNYPPATALESEVLELLNKGRSRESSYDLKNSPVSTFIIKWIGFDGVRNLLPPAKDFFAGKISDREFLSKCNPKMVAAIAEGVMQVFESRKLALREFSLPAKVG